MPDNLNDLYENLEESDAHQAKLILSRLSRVEAGSLAVFIREKLLQDREVVAEELERDLQVNLIFGYKFCRSLKCNRVNALLEKCGISALSS